MIVRITKFQNTPGYIAARLIIPTAVARSLPDSSEWELTVTDDGLHLSYIRECAKGREARNASISLPFVAQKDPA